MLNYVYILCLILIMSTKPKLNCIQKNLGGAQGACTLHKHRSMQPEPNCLNKGVLTLNLLYYYLDTIFVPPVLGHVKRCPLRQEIERCMKICIN